MQRTFFLSISDTTAIQISTQPSYIATLIKQKFYYRAISKRIFLSYYFVDLSLMPTVNATKNTVL
jgi:hypothetical protein